MPPATGLLKGLTGANIGLDLASSLYGMISGISQRREGRKLLDEVDRGPKYQIPEGISQQVGLRQAMLNARNPAFQDLENDIFANQAGTIFNARQAAPGSSALLGTIGTSQAETNRALRAAAMQEQGQYEQRLRGLEAAQNAMAAQQQKAYEYNVIIPQERKYAYGQELMGVGQENVYGGLRGMAGLAGNTFRSELQNSTLSLLFPNLFKQRKPRQANALNPGAGYFQSMYGGGNINDGMVNTRDNTNAV